MKYNSLFIIAGLALCMTGCQKELAQNEVANDGQKCTIHVLCDETKTANDGPNTVWVSSDNLTVFYQSGNAFKNTKFENSGESTFSGIINSPDADGVWFAVYPFDEANVSPESVSVSIAANPTQIGNNNTSHLAGEGFPLYGAAMAEGKDVPDIVMHQAATVGCFNILNSMQSPIVVKSIEFTAPTAIAGTFSTNLLANSIEWTAADGASETVTLTVTDGEEIGAFETASFFIGMLPFEATGDFTISVTAECDGETVVSTATAEELTMSCQAGYFHMINHSFYYEEEEPEQPEEPALPEVNQGTFELVNDGMRTFIADAEAQYTDSNRKTVSLVTTNNRSKYGFGGNGDLYQSGTNVTANDRPLPVTLTLDSALNGSNVSVTVYKNSEKTEVENTVSGTVSNAKFEIYNLIPNRTYYYTVNQNSEAVAIGYFQTTGTRRIIKVSDTIYADNANNCRDLGGLPTVDGGYIKYGKIFRGTNIDATTAAEQAILTGYLNIGLDVDLRGLTLKDGKTRNIARQIISTIDYDSQNYNGGSDLLVGDKIKGSITSIVNALNNNKACYIHCFAGADRTGYFCSLILALCGVSNKEITIDYELTSFSCVDLRDRNGKIKKEAFYNNFPTLEGYTGSTLKQKAENLLKSYGITDAQISAIRAALVEYPNN